MIFSDGGGSDAGIVTDNAGKSTRKTSKEPLTPKVTEYIK